MSQSICPAVNGDDVTVRCSEPLGHGPFSYITEDAVIDASHGNPTAGVFWVSAPLPEGPEETLSLEVTSVQFETILSALATLAGSNSAFGEVYEALYRQV